MKRFLSFLACVSLLVATLSVGMTAEANFGRSYTVTKGSPVIDGEVDEVWATAKWTNVDKVFDGVRETDSMLRIKCLWDENGFYFLAEVYDTSISKRNNLVEIYLDQLNDKTVPYNDDDSQTRFYVHSTGVASTGSNPQFDAESGVAELGDNKYRVEGKLNWFNGAPTIGQEMGLEFMYNDGGEFTSLAEAYRWNVDTASGEERSSINTSNWGTAIFAEAGEPLPADTYVDGETINTNEDAPTGDDFYFEDMDEEDEKDGAGWILYAGIGAAVVVIAIIVIVIVSKKKMKEQ